MNLTVTEQAREYIVKEGSIITVRMELRPIPSCNKLQTAAVPVVKLGNPEEHEQNNYQVFNIDGMQIYAHSSILDGNNQASLRIDTQLNLFGKTLVMYGLPIPHSSCGNCTSC